jgi:CBS domain-containing protein
MKNTLREKVSPPTRPRPATAADLMTPNPVCIPASATVEEVIAFLADTGYSAAPVIDSADRPIGVVSRTDVVVYERAKVASSADAARYYDRQPCRARAKPARG